MFAITKGNLEVVKYLVEKGAEINMTTKDRVTLLGLAAREGHFEVVKYLAENGAEINMTTKDGVTPLGLAAREGHFKVVKYLAENGTEINMTTKDGVTPLGLAAREGHFEVVKYLAENGAEVDQADNAGVTPLLRAAYCGHLEVVEFLLKNGADINEDIIDEDRDIVKDRLIIAMHKGESDKVERLCKDYANSNIHGTSILELAVKIGREEIVKCLLDNGADVNKANSNGATPLHIAAQKGHPNIVRLLFDYGADSTVFIDKEQTSFFTSFFRTTYVPSFDKYSDDVKKVIEEISTEQAISMRDLRLEMQRTIQKQLGEIQKSEIELKEELKSYLNPYDDNWRDSFYFLTTFSSDNSLPSFTEEDLKQLFEDKTFKSILLLNHADSMVDKYKVIGRKSIFNIAKTEHDISDDDEKKYEEYKKQSKTNNVIDIKHVIYDMLSIQRSAPPREERPAQTLTSPLSTSATSATSAHKQGAARC